MDDTTQARSRWFHVTPGHFVIGMLAVEVLLWLTEWFGWLEWHKGYAVLTCVAVVGVAMLLMGVWFTIALFFRWRFQFSLRSLLVLVVIVAMPCGWFATSLRKAKKQQEAVAAVIEAKGTVWYDFSSDAAAENLGLLGSEGPIANDELPGPVWINKLLGLDYFYNVKEVYVGRVYPVGSLGRQTTAPTYDLGSDDLLAHIASLSHTRTLDATGPRITDAGITHIALLTELRSLNLLHSQVTDSGLEQLYRLGKLRNLDLRRTKVTDAGIAKLQQALPDCKITR